MKMMPAVVIALAILIGFLNPGKIVFAIRHAQHCKAYGPPDSNGYSSCTWETDWGEALDIYAFNHH